MKMAIVNAVDMFLDAMPERGRVLGNDTYARLKKGLDQLVDIYHDLKDESRGAAVAFNDNRGKVLAHAAEYNPGNSYGHDLFHSFLHAGHGLVENIKDNGLPDGLNMQILKLFSSGYPINLDGEVIPFQNGILHGLEVKAYEKNHKDHNQVQSNLWAEFMSSRLGHNKKVLFGQPDKIGIVLIDPHSTKKADLRSLVNKAMANAGIQQADKYDLAVHRINGNVIYG